MAESVVTTNKEELSGVSSILRTGSDSSHKRTCLSGSLGSVINMSLSRPPENTVEKLSFA